MTKSSLSSVSLPVPTEDEARAVPPRRAQPSPVIPEKRKPLTRAQRLRMHDEHGSKCVVCLEQIPAGEPFIDEHIIPLALGGSNDKSNRGPAHVGCAKIKTQRDQRMIAKAKRQRMKHLGIKKPSSFPCSKASPWRKKVNGKVELR